MNSLNNFNKKQFDVMLYIFIQGRWNFRSNKNIKAYVLIWWCVDVMMWRCEQLKRHNGSTTKEWMPRINLDTRRQWKVGLQFNFSGQSKEILGTVFSKHFQREIFQTSDTAEQHLGCFQPCKSLSWRRLTNGYKDKFLVCD